MKKVKISLLLILLPVYIFSVQIGEQKLIYSGHWIYDALDTLALESGSVTLASSSAPISIAEMRMYLDKINFENLTESGQTLYDEVLSFFDNQVIGFSSGAISAGIDPSLQPEVFFKTNQDVEWVHDYSKRGKAVLLPLYISADKYITFFSDFFFSQNYTTSLKNDVYSNIPYSGSAFSAEFPQNAGLSTGAFIKDVPFINFQLGSGSLNMFKTQMGSVALSDSMEGVNYARLSIFSPKLRYIMLPMQLSVNKYFYVHQLEWSPFERLSVSVMEGVLVNAPFELRFINPLMVFHNYSSWLDYSEYNKNIGGQYPEDSGEGAYASSQFAIYLNFNPWKYLRLYGIFGFNQFQTQYEKTNFPDDAATIPDSLAYQAGIESYIPFKKGYLYAGGEFVYTTPWMYICRSPGWSFYRTYDELVGSGSVKNWTGSPFGPDCIACQIKLGYQAESRKWQSYLSYRLTIHGEQSFDLFNEIDGSGRATYYPTTKEEAMITTPTGTPQYANRIALDGEYQMFSFLSLKGQTAYTIVLNNGNISGNNQNSFECSLSVSLNNIASVF